MTKGYTFVGAVYPCRENRGPRTWSTIECEPRTPGPMSVNATDLDSSDTADILPQGWRCVPDLTQYILERLRSDSDFVLSRGRYLGTDPISPHSILVLSPVSE